MAITTEKMAAWCRKLLGAEPNAPRLSLEQYLAGIPRIDCLGKLPAGTAVLVRGDVDAKPGPKVGDGDIRLRSMKDTLKFGQERGWKQVIFGHVGREPEKSLNKVAARLGEILGCQVTFIEDWLDPATVTIKEEAAKTIAQSPPGSIIMLQNTRKYDIERRALEGQAGRYRQAGRETRQAGQRVCPEGRQSLRSRGILRRQFGRFERRGSCGNGESGAGHV